MSLSFRSFTVLIKMQRINWRRRGFAFALVMSALFPCRLTFASDTDTSVDIWVQDAPLAMVIKQIASLAGKSTKITGAIEGQVSGHFSGSLADTLASLAATHGVLFDLQDDSLHVISYRALSNISVTLPGYGLDDSLHMTLGEVPFPGNSVLVQGALVKVSGHPNFVKRVVSKIGAGQFVYSVKGIATSSSVEPLTLSVEETPELSAAFLTKDQPLKSLQITDGERISEPLVAVAAKLISEKRLLSLSGSTEETIASTKTQPSIDEVAIAYDGDLNNAASIEAVDIKIGSEPSANASLATTSKTEKSESKPARRINSVTDIPGFYTF
jgi:hypothetical protein